MTLSLCLLTALISGNTLTFKTQQTLEPVPAESDYYLSEPSSFDYDAAGRIYVLDRDARVIFRWAADGKYLGTIGTPGQGPGEFVFGNRGPSGGYLSICNDMLYVYDMGKREILIFDTEGRYQKSFSPKSGRGRVLGFWAVNENRFLLHRRSVMEDDLFTSIAEVDAEGKLIKEYDKVADDTFNMKGDRGSRQFSLKLFNSRLVMDYNEKNKTMAFGMGGEPKLRVKKLGEDQARSVVLPLLEEEIGDVDREEVEARFGQMLSSGRLKVEYPEKKAFYDEIRLCDQGILAYTQSPYYTRINGVLTGLDGKVKGRFDIRCGINGGIFSAKGRLLVVRLDEDDEFRLEMVTL